MSSAAVRTGWAAPAPATPASCHRRRGGWRRAWASWRTSFTARLRGRTPCRCWCEQPWRTCSSKPSTPSSTQPVLDALHRPVVVEDHLLGAIPRRPAAADHGLSASERRSGGPARGRTGAPVLPNHLPNRGRSGPICLVACLTAEACDSRSLGLGFPENPCPDWDLGGRGWRDSNPRPTV